jgi:glucosamine--fructose-6-phosphate aminotransferase (isomerizing)
VLEQAAAADWTAAVAPLRDASEMLVLGRGPSLPIAGEAALKLKETSNLHAEAFSSAEVAHGPMTLVGAGDPVLVLAPLDIARTGLRARLEDFAARGANVIAAGLPEDVAPASWSCRWTRRSTRAGRDRPDPELLRPGQCAFAGAGCNPDSPPHLNKVTRTL